MDPASLMSVAGGAASALAKPPESKSETNNRIVNKGPRLSTNTDLGAQDIRLKRLKVGKKANVTLNLGGEPTTAPETETPAPAAASSGIPTWAVVALVVLLLALAAYFLSR